MTGGEESGPGDASRHWRVTSSRSLFKALPYVEVTVENVVTADGHVIDDFFRVDLASFALCVPRTVTGHIITLWGYKHGARRVALGFPAGLIEPDESPDAACRRELIEETGYAPGRLTPVGSFVDNGNQRGATGHYFVAEGCDRIAAPRHDPGEIAEVRLMDARQIDAALAEGAFAVVHHVAAWALARPLLC